MFSKFCSLFTILALVFALFSQDVAAQPLSEAYPQDDTARGMTLPEGAETGNALPVPAPAAAIAAAPIATSTPSVPSANYESFLSSIEATIISMQPEKVKLDSEKAAVNANSPASKDEYESSEAYEKRIAEFEKKRQEQIAALDQAFQAKNKDIMDKLKKDITDKKDLQPNWGGTLKPDTDIDGYNARIESFKDKISAMNIQIGKITAEIAKLDFGSDSKQVNSIFEQKNALYISRLERAQEVMKDYIVQHHARVLTTEKHKPEMSLGAYNPDSQEFEFSMNDENSSKVPFSYSGKIRILPDQAREMNRQTTDLSASIDYINFPLITPDATLYPGVKRPHMFYKDNEISVTGSFQIVQSITEAPGFMQWAIYADSILSGTLVPKNLDSAYAMSIGDIKVEKYSSKELFGINKIVLRIATIGVTAAAAGLAYKFNSDISPKNDKAVDLANQSALFYQEGNIDRANELLKSANKQRDDAAMAQNLRNGFYIGAGLGAAATILTFVF